MASPWQALDLPLLPDLHDTSTFDPMALSRQAYSFATSFLICTTQAHSAQWPHHGGPRIFHYFPICTIRAHLAQWPHHDGPFLSLPPSQFVQLGHIRLNGLTLVGLRSFATSFLIYTRAHSTRWPRHGGHVLSLPPS